LLPGIDVTDQTKGGKTFEVQEQAGGKASAHEYGGAEVKVTQQN
jgi:hypothetical protein